VGFEDVEPAVEVAWGGNGCASFAAKRRETRWKSLAKVRVFLWLPARSMAATVAGVRTSLEGVLRLALAWRGIILVTHCLEQIVYNAEGRYDP